MRRLLEIAHGIEAVQDGRIHIEKINYPMLFKEGATPAEYKAGLDLAIARGLLWLHENGSLRHQAQSCFVKCRLCEDYGWVCEEHPERPWEGPHACICGAAGAPCAVMLRPMERRRAFRTASGLSSIRTAGDTEREPHH